ncbi:MAG: hypothetical protein K6E35_02115 [Bacteroidales bacterium]|nr:hypothetical protein [Bacteroidales bacterium]
MKKIIALLAGVLAFAAVASAQPRAVGIRTGWTGAFGIEASYQHYMGNNFIEGDLGISGNTLCVTGIYDFMIGSAGEFDFYGGPGAMLSIGESFGAAICGQIGAEWPVPTVPVTVSLDWRPAFLLTGGGFYWQNICLGIRYSF